MSRCGREVETPHRLTTASHSWWNSHTHQGCRVVKLSKHRHRTLEKCSIPGESEAASGDDGDGEPQCLFEVTFAGGDVREACAPGGVTQEVDITMFV